MPKIKKEVEKKVSSNATSNVKKAAGKKSEISAKKAPIKEVSTLKKTAVKLDSKKVLEEKKAPKTGKISNTSKNTTNIVKKSKSSKSKKAKPITKAKVVASKSSSEEKNKFVNILEYYDLPYRYNETVVKILAQTPKILFVYWDISDKDRNEYTKKYGKYFFNDTYPVLLVHNKTLNYTQEVEINDFANSWYISIPDSRSEYSVELGRRFKEYVKRNPEMPHKEELDSVVSVAYSNDLVMPNDHVLLDELKPQIKYRNVKTNEESYKSISHILGDKQLVDFYGLYKELYQVENLSNVFSLSNPSSGNPTSTFK